MKFHLSNIEIMNYTYEDSSSNKKIICGILKGIVIVILMEDNLTRRK